MIKMVVSDMDGTLLNKDLVVSEENLKAIKYLRDKGIRFCIATGRPEQLVKEYIDVLKMEDPCIMYNGSVIGHPRMTENIYELRLSKDDVREIITYCEKNDIIYMPYTKEKIISKPNYRRDFFLERNKLLKEQHQAIFEDVKDIDEIVNGHHINKVLLIENDAEKYNKVKELFMSNENHTIATSQTGFIDINPKGATKGNALKVLADYFGYTLEEIVVFGDQDNDVSMLEIAGISVAMENGSKNAKAVSKFVTKSNNDNGFADWVFKNL